MVFGIWLPLLLRPQHHQRLHGHRLPHRFHAARQRFAVRQGHADPHGRFEDAGYTAQIVFASTDFTDDATRESISS